MREEYSYTFKVFGEDSSGGLITDKCKGPEELNEVIEEYKDKGWKIRDIEVSSSLNQTY